MTNKEWRPDGWEKTEQELLNRWADARMKPKTLINASASEILQALRKEPNLYCGKRAAIFNIPFGFMPPCNGRLVFIPDDPKPEINDSCEFTIFKNKTNKDLIITGWDNNYPIFHPKPHPASQVIESGYFCDECGMKILDNFGFSSERYSFNHDCGHYPTHRGISY